MVLWPHPRRSDWDDLSDFVVHLTRNNAGINAAFNFVAILRDGRIEARNRFGIGYAFDQCPSAVCLTETPLHQMIRIADRRSVFGIGFLKSFVAEAGGGPVGYLYGDRQTAARSLMREAIDDAENPIWKLAPFLDGPRQNYSFEWEREWRVPRELAFQPEQVCFLTGPDDEHDRMREYFEQEHRESDFPNYQMPLIDLRWSRERMHEELGRQ